MTVSADLHVLTLTLQPGVTPTLGLVVRTGDGEGAVELSIPFAESGLPERPEELRSFRSWRGVALAEDLMAQLELTLPPRGSIVYLEFGRPRGHLGLMPWERLLAPLGRRWLRLPYLPIAVVAPPVRPVVAVVASLPMAKAAFDLPELVVQLVGLAAHAYADAGGIHVFVDRDQVGSVRRRLGEVRLPRGCRIEVHDPEDTPESKAPPRDARIARGADSPWLRWMGQGLAGAQVDAFFFLCHGYLSRGRGAVAWAQSPWRNDDAYWARFVGAEDLGEFLERFGTRATFLVSPPADFRVSGLLALADGLAQQRPESVGVIDAEDGLGGEDLSWAPNLALGRSRAPEEAPKVTLYSSPSFLPSPEQSQGLDDEFLGGGGADPAPKRFRSLPEPSPPTGSLSVAVATKGGGYGRRRPATLKAWAFRPQGQDTEEPEDGELFLGGGGRGTFSTEDDDDFLMLNTRGGDDEPPPKASMGFGEEEPNVDPGPDVSGDLPGRREPSAPPEARKGGVLLDSGLRQVERSMAELEVRMRERASSEIATASREGVKEALELVHRALQAAKGGGKR
ncbi:MAG: hypothetical protein AAGN66_21770 [Acidobacteriota bacterium]